MGSYNVKPLRLGSFTQYNAPEIVFQEHPSWSSKWQQNILYSFTFCSEKTFYSTEFLQFVYPFTYRSTLGDLQFGQMWMKLLYRDWSGLKLAQLRIVQLYQYSEVILNQQTWTSIQNWDHFQPVVLVRVSISVKRQHDQGNMYKKQHLIGADFQVLRLSSFLAWIETWQHLGRHGTGGPKVSISCSKGKQ